MVGVVGWRKCWLRQGLEGGLAEIVVTVINGRRRDVAGRDLSKYLSICPSKVSRFLFTLCASGPLALFKILVEVSCLWIHCGISFAERMKVQSAINKKGRRVWTNEEMLALLEALENQARSGGISPGGNLKPGTAGKMEQELSVMFPNSGLRADPHIASAIKALKTQHHLITELLTVSGFGWNDEKKCVMCDSDDAWNTYIQREKRVKNYRNKSFPYYERLLGIFGKDRANGQESITVGDARDESNKEVDEQNGGDAFVEERSVNQTAATNGGDDSLARKRAKVGEMLSASINNLGDKIVEVMTKSRETVDKLIDSISSNKKMFEDQRAVCGELKNMDLTIQERVIAARKVLDCPQNVHIFWGFDGDDRVAYVKHLINEN